MDNMCVFVLSTYYGAWFPLKSLESFHLMMNSWRRWRFLTFGKSPSPHPLPKELLIIILVNVIVKRWQTGSIQWQKWVKIFTFAYDQGRGCWPSPPYGQHDRKISVFLRLPSNRDICSGLIWGNRESPTFYDIFNKTWPQILIRWHQKLISWHQFKPGTKK